MNELMTFTARAFGENTDGERATTELKNSDLWTLYTIVYESFRKIK